MSEIVQYVLDGATTGSLYVLLALGFTLVFGVMGMMNVAHADLYMLAVFTLVWVADDAGLGTVVGVLAGTAAACVVGYLVYLVVLRRVHRTAEVSLFVGTLGVSFFVENFVAKIVDFRERSVEPLFPSHLFRFGGVRLANGDLVVLVFTVLIGLALLAWLKYSATGRLLRAVSEKPALSELVGIDTARMMALAVVVSAFIAGLGGILVASQTQGIGPFVANDVSLKMFAVAVVAGVGSVGGAIVVGFGLGIVESLTVAYVGSTWQNVIGLLAMVVVLLVRPQGLFGRASRVG